MLCLIEPSRQDIILHSDLSQFSQVSTKVKHSKNVCAFTVCETLKAKIS